MPMIIVCIEIGIFKHLTREKRLRRGIKQLTFVAI